MSRNAPFPTVPSRRPRSPATFDQSAGSSYANNLPPTQPLSISRPRPRSPANPAPQVSDAQAYGGIPVQPLRPARSDRRPRQPPSLNGQEGPPSAYSVAASSSSRSDANGGYTANNGYNGSGRQSPAPSRYDQRTKDRSNTIDTQSSRRTDDDPYGGMEYAASSPSVESPKALGAVVSAFQQAASSARRKNTIGSDGVASDREWERQRERERREQALLRARKANGLVTGDIDGMDFYSILRYS